MGSIWRKPAHMPQFEPLTEDIKTDVLIIGGGLAGLLCAYELSQAGTECVLVEADRLCAGITRNTTAKITSQHGLCYHKLLSRFGEEKARLYYEANDGALARYRNLCQSIDCDFEETDAFVYSRTDHLILEKELQALKRLGINVQTQKKIELPFPVAGAIRFQNQAQFHPLKFAAAITKDLRIFEHTKVRELAQGKVVTDKGTIRANNAVVATHFPILNRYGGYFLKQYQHRSYVLALENVPKVDGMYVDAAKKGLSFRDYGDLLLLGGGGHRTGKFGGGWRELEQFVHKYHPQAQIVARWATQDCMTLDGVPYIGRYAKTTPNLYVTTGFNKWGMTSAMAGAALLKDLICGKVNPYAELFDPSRTVLRPQLAANAAEAILSWVTPTSPRCPHMGCALKYNKAEHTWDCPCHGSRFAIDGKLIDNPATDDKKGI